MTPESKSMTLLDKYESWTLLSSVALGRLVVVIDDRPEIFPINFVTQRGTVLFRTAEGTKLFGSVVSDQVLFEADDHNDIGGWSVVVRGAAQVLNTSVDIDEADRAGLYPWIPTVKLHYVRIIPSQINGRRFVFGREPEGGHVPG
ncbi:pyridoxamine 5'-phosphate oxidase family protein [Mycobacterium sp. NPDC050853]|uniref:pyridoxamine 5'-phosphate oxidase family protein n=1 Tax=Mycobacteriaceae TaxID=1762 RepID=UPI0015DF09D8|nr:pyridoxamine 5'-phosphate oxidase family protein [Mycobacteroides sp. LB1]